MLLAEPLTQNVTGLAIEVHRHLGPGLLESVYEQCLALELRRAGIDFARQVAIPVLYKDEQIDNGFRPTSSSPRRSSWKSNPSRTSCPCTKCK